jgi:RNA polymerase sigma-70 factor (ECF subfamily)
VKVTLFSTSSTRDQTLVDAARAGDEDAFRQLVEPHRSVLQGHCYRMLGSLQDAEDAMQDSLLRAWRGLRGLRSGQQLRPWLFRIATNVCLDMAAKRPRRVVRVEGSSPAPPVESGVPCPPVVESIWLEPFPDEVFGLTDTEAEPAARYEQRESVELAFIAALQHLPPRQRAVLILRDVFGFPASEVAEFLETTTAAVNSALQRARGAVEEGLPPQSQQAMLRAIGSARVRELVDSYVDAWERNDVDAIRTLLVHDATFAMPPYAEWWQGREDIIAIMRKAGAVKLRHVSCVANGEPAIAWYLWDGESESYRPSAIEIMTVEEAGIRQITAFVMPELFPRFGLPEELRATAA